MNIHVLCIGKTGKTFLIEGEKTFLDRLKHYIHISYTQLPDIKGKNLSTDQIKVKEGEQLLQKISNSDYVIILDENGKQYSSLDFSKQIQEWMNRGTKTVMLIIGGPYGFSEQIYARANGKISLSKMTFSHQMVRLFLFEQLYRGFTILKNEPYHHQ